MAGWKARYVAKHALEYNLRPLINYETPTLSPAALALEACQGLRTTPSRLLYQKVQNASRMWDSVSIITAMI